MNSELLQKKRFDNTETSAGAVILGDRPGFSLLFWLCALAAALFFSLARGSVKFGTFVIVCTFLCAACDYFKPRFLYRPDGGGALVLIGLFFGTVSAGLYFFFANVGEVDFACYTNVLWNTLHGRFLYQSFLGENLLAIHMTPAILVFIPFYALLGNYGLIIAQSLAWTGGLWLLLSAEEKRYPVPRLLVFAIALSPPLIAPLFYGFHPDILFLPVAAWALRAYKSNQIVQFFTAVLLLPLIKEVFVLAALGFALLAVLDKRALLWSAVPALLSIVLVLLFWFVISPALRAGSSHVFISLLPSSPVAVFKQFFSGATAMFMLSSLLLVLPALLSHSLKLALLPLLFFLFYAVLPDQSFRDVWRHYALAGAWMALFSLAYCAGETLRKMAAPFFLVSVCSCYIWLPHLTAPRATAQKRIAIATAISMVPSEKTLVAHGPFMAMASQRHGIMNWVYANDSWKNYDFLLFDSSFRPCWWSGKDTLDRHIRRLLESPEWKPAFHQEYLYLFKKTP